MNKKGLLGSEAQANPKISVITPVLDCRQHIQRAIDSVLEQGYPNFEHIVVDGGSTDGTLDILRANGHLRWTSERDEGQIDAMIKGFDLSTGDVIVYLNADDYFFPGAFFAAAEEIAGGAPVVMGNVLVQTPGPKVRYVNVPKVRLTDMIRHWEFQAYCVNPVGYFYRREVQIACPFNRDNDLTMDLEFLLDVASRFEIRKVDFLMGCFDNHATTKTRISQHRLDYWQPKNFPYIDKHVSAWPLDQVERFEADRRRAYAARQARSNKLLKTGYPHVVPSDANPVVSVIIPTINRAKNITKAVSSVLVQNLSKLEVIIVDDASTDDTAELLHEAFPNNRMVNIIRHPRTHNQGAARNTGLDAAKGKYVLFLDADDWLESGALGRLVGAAGSYDADVVAFGVQKVFPNGRKKPFQIPSVACEGGRYAINAYADHLIASSVWNKLYRRDFIENEGIRFTEGGCFEEVLFTLKVVHKCRRFISIPDVLYNYSQRPSSVMLSRPTVLHFASAVRIGFDIVDYFNAQEIGSDRKDQRLLSRLLEAHTAGELSRLTTRMGRAHRIPPKPEDFVEEVTRLAGTRGIFLSAFLRQLIVQLRQPRRWTWRWIVARLESIVRRGGKKILRLSSSPLRHLVRRVKNRRLPPTKPLVPG